jgi:hypothetical protein
MHCCQHHDDSKLVSFCESIHLIYLANYSTVVDLESYLARSKSVAIADLRSGNARIKK